MYRGIQDQGDVGIRGTEGLMDIVMSGYSADFYSILRGGAGHLRPPHHRFLPDADCGLPPPLALLCDQTYAGEGSGTDRGGRRHCNLRNTSVPLSSGLVVC